MSLRVSPEGGLSIIAQPGNGTRYALTVTNDPDGGFVVSWPQAAWSGVFVVAGSAPRGVRLHKVWGHKRPTKADPLCGISIADLAAIELAVVEALANPAERGPRVSADARELFGRVLARGVA